MLINKSGLITWFIIMTCCPWTACYYILNKTAMIPTNVGNSILSEGRELERKTLRTQWNSVNSELRLRRRKGRWYPTLRVISNTLRSMRHYKNMAPEEDFVMRERLLYSLGEKNYFLIASVCFTYIMSQTLLWSCYCLGSVWSEGQWCFQSFSPENFPCWIHSYF